MADLISMLAAAAGAAAGGGEVDPNFNQTVLLLHGDGTNGAQNNTFVDSSTNNFTITRNGNTTQGTFSPFSAPDGRWSNYFDGANDWFNLTNNADFDFGSGDLTIECWFYLTGNAAANPAGTRSAQIFNAFPNSGTRSDDYDFRVDGDGSATGTGLTFRTTISGSSQSTTYTATITKNTWHHFAAVKSGNTVSLFYDGVRVQQNASVTNQVNSGGNPIKIGALRYTDGASQLYDNSFPGYISNLRVLNGTALYSGATYTVPTSPLTAIANTVLLTCQSNRFVDNSTNNFAITANGNVKVTPFSPFAPTAAYDPAVNSGSGYFDGTGDSLSITDVSSLLDFGTGAFTISLWFYQPNATNDCAIIDARQTGANSGWFLAINNTNNLRFSNQTGGVDIIGSSTIVAGQWYFVHISRSGTTVSLYLNGVSDGSGTDSGNYNCDGIVFGAKRFTSSGFNAFPGYLSSINLVSGMATSNAIPSSPTTGGTFLCNFTNAAILDNTGKNNLETVGNAQIDTTTKKFGTGSMEFDGTGDYLVVNSGGQDLAFGSGAFTVEFWVYINTVKNNALVDFRANGVGTGAYITLYQDSGGTIRLYVNGADRITGGSLSIDTWYHIALTRSGTDTKLFIDGTQSGSTYTDSTVYLNASNRPLIGQVGDDPSDATFPFDGFIDDLRITKGVARYITTFTPPTKAFPDL